MNTAHTNRMLRIILFAILTFLLLAVTVGFPEKSEAAGAEGTYASVLIANNKGWFAGAQDDGVCNGKTDGQWNMIKNQDEPILIPMGYVLVTTPPAYW